jgi:hypothetical protein
MTAALGINLKKFVKKCLWNVLRRLEAMMA